jgi:peptidoglycan/LPS O-acetylase OafA/YrhL
MDQRFYPELESLRGLAALVVLLHHTSLMFGVATKEVLWGSYPVIVGVAFPGGAAVILFFLLSGFVLSQTIRSSPKEALQNLPGYVVRRMCRIVPAMWLAVGVAASVAFFAGSVVTSETIWQHLLFQAWGMDAPLWSLRVELWLSLLLPALVVVAARAGVWGNIAIQFGLLYFWWAQHPILQFAFVFHVGFLVPTFGRWVIERLRGWPLRILLSVSLITFCGFHTFSGTLWPGLYRESIVACSPASFLLVAWTAAEIPGRWRDLLSTEFLRFAGRISYSVYVLHLPILIALVQVYVRTFGMPVGFASIASTLVVAMFSVPIILAVSSISYRYVELPFIAAGKWLTRSQWVLDAKECRQLVVQLNNSRVARGEFLQSQ